MRLLLSVPSVVAAIGRRGLSLGALPVFAAEQGYDGIELDDRMLDRYTPAALATLAERRRATGGELVLNLNADLTARDARQRRAARDDLAGWIDRAPRLDVRTARLCVGGQSLSVQKLLARRARGRAPERAIDDPPPPAPRRWLGRLAHAYRSRSRAPRHGVEKRKQRAADVLRELVPRLESTGLRLAIENHWGLTTRPRDLIDLVERVGSPRVGVCLDFRNFPRGIDRDRAIRGLAPRAIHVHAHTRGLSADGVEDLERCLGVLLRNGYRDAVTIEYHGPGDGIDGSRATRRTIERILDRAG